MENSSTSSRRKRYTLIPCCMPVLDLCSRCSHVVQHTGFIAWVSVAQTSSVVRGGSTYNGFSVLVCSSCKLATSKATVAFLFYSICLCTH